MLLAAGQAAATGGNSPLGSGAQSLLREAHERNLHHHLLHYLLTLSGGPFFCFLTEMKLLSPPRELHGRGTYGRDQAL